MPIYFMQGINKPPLPPYYPNPTLQLFYHIEYPHYNATIYCLSVAEKCNIPIRGGLQGAA
jgi:hypothetical protein